MSDEQRFHKPLRRAAIVGSGMAGLVVAAGLQEAGVEATLFEKSRGPGGRMAAKRLPSPSEGAADIGAQYFTLRNPEFREFLDKHVGHSGWGEWHGHFRYQDQDNVWQDMRPARRFVGIPRMSAITRAISKDLDLRTGIRIIRLDRDDRGRWTLTDAEGSTYPGFDAVILTPPPAQTMDLLNDSGLAGLTEDPHLAGGHMQACWTVVVHFPQGAGLAFEGFQPNSARLHWAANNSSKPGRDDEGEWWVLHGDPVWSEANTDMDPQRVEEELLAEFRRCSGSTNPAGERMVHRWLYAMPRPAKAPGHLWFEDHAIGIAGDWLDGGRVEGAFNSADSLLDQLLASGLINWPVGWG